MKNLLLVRSLLVLALILGLVLPAWAAVTITSSKESIGLGAYPSGAAASGNILSGNGTSWATTTTGTGVVTWITTPSSANLATAVTGETGSGALVFAESPTLVTPALGTPASGVLTNATGLPIAGITGLGAGVGTWLGIPSSANLASAVTGETGSGGLVFDTSPTLATPVLGVASATSINKVAFTTPATSATLTIADGKTFTASNTLTFTGSDASSVAFGAGGTVAYTNVTTLSSLASGGTITTGVWNGTDIAVADGGTGASTAADARTNLGLVIGTDVLAYDADLAQLLTGTAATPQFARLGLGAAADATAPFSTNLAATTPSGIFLNVASGETQSIVFRSARGTIASPTQNLGDGSRLEFQARAENSTWVTPGYLVFSPDGAAPTSTDSRGRIQFYTTPSSSVTPTERARFTSAGALLINGTAAYGRNSQMLELNSTTNGGAAISSWSATDTEPLLDFNKAKSGAVGTLTTALANGDTLGNISFRLSDTSVFRVAASIRGLVDGTPAAGDAPGRLAFYTTLDGGVTEAERMRITSTGAVYINDGTTTALDTDLTTLVGTDVGLTILRTNAASTNESNMAIVGNGASTNGAAFGGFKTRGTAMDANTIVVNGDGVLAFTGYAADGVGYIQAAAIAINIDGTPGVNDMPGLISFRTTADGAASTTERARIANNGNIFMYDLEVNAGAASTVCIDAVSEELWSNGTGACLASSIRYKKNIKPMDLGLSTVLALAPVTFNWKATGNKEVDADPNKQARQMGFIAEEAQKIDRRLIGVDSRDADQAASFQYMTYTAVLTKGIQELAARETAATDGLTKLVNAQAKTIEALQSRIAALEKPKPSPKPTRTPKPRTGWLGFKAS